jgi:hypothetical protein
VTNYAIPAQATSSRVWLLDHPEHGGPLPADRVQEDIWKLRTRGDRYDLLSWAELLAVGTVTDEDPNDVSWIGAFPLRAHGSRISTANGYEALSISGDWSIEADERFAQLIVRLLNEHAARQAGEPS